MNYSCNYAKNYPESVPELPNIYCNDRASKVRAKSYCMYSSINGGNIRYYPNERPIEQVFSAPLFSNNSKIICQHYKDPMDSIKPEYTRIQTKNNGKHLLTLLQDTNEQREELIGLQMRKMNQSLFEPKWNY